MLVSWFVCANSAGFANVLDFADLLFSRIPKVFGISLFLQDSQIPRVSQFWLFANFEVFAVSWA